MDSLTTLEVFRYRLPLRSALNLGEVTIAEREGLLVRLTSEGGAVGWGEIAPLPEFSRERLDDAADQILNLRTEIIRRLSPESGARAAASSGRNRDGDPDLLQLYPSVRFGVDQARLWLNAAREDTSVPALLRKQSPSSIPVNGLLVGGSVDDLEASAAKALERGYRSVKLKVGRGSIDDDVRAVRAVSRILGANASLRLDANRAWTAAEARRFAGQISNVAVEYIEEPLADPHELAAFAAEISIPVALDETVRSITPEELPDYSFADALILKPTLVGGRRKLTSFVQAARREDMTPVVSASFESGIGLLGLAWLSAGFGLDEIPAGLDTWRWLQEDLLAPPLQCTCGRITSLDSSPADLHINDRFLSPVS